MADLLAIYGKEFSGCRGWRQFQALLARMPAGNSLTMLHILKLAVGARDVTQLAEFQRARAISDPPLRHKTRNSPKRAEEITAGGSLYWVVNGAILVRQRITAIIRDHWKDGAGCAALVLDPELIGVAARAMKPFQGWRYLNAADAPADLGGDPTSGADALPEPMRLALSRLALL